MSLVDVMSTVLSSHNTVNYRPTGHAPAVMESLDCLRQLNKNLRWNTDQNIVIRRQVDNISPTALEGINELASENYGNANINRNTQ